MKILLPMLKPAHYRGLLLTSVLLAALSAAALQNQTRGLGSGQAQALVARSAVAHSTSSGTGSKNPPASPGRPSTSPTTLTPAAPVSSQVPASSEEDIRDIRQPRHLPTPIPWIAVAAGVILLAAAAIVSWKWLRRRHFLAQAPYEVALAQLEAARRLMDPEQAREYCFAVSEIIRNYLQVQFHLHAPRLTTEEFLRELVEVRETMLASHRSLLGDFLQHCDLAKFAGWRYSQAALEDMHGTASDFVKQTGAEVAALAAKATCAAVETAAKATPAPADVAAQVETSTV